MRVGFIGIGNMGWPMARNVLRGGFELTVYDADPGRSAKFGAEHRCSVVSRLADLAGLDFIVTMLPTGRDVAGVYLGENGLAQHLDSRTIAVDMSSSDPTGTRELGQALVSRGVRLLDAPVSGGVPRAEAGTLAIMIGGNDAEAIERAKPLLATMGNKLFEIGALGSGHAMKALNNYVASAGFVAAVEALAIGRRFGIDPSRMLEVINQSTGRNFNTESTMQENVIDARYATGFALGLMTKDVGIAAELARAMKVDAPVAQLVSQRWVQARDSLGAARDFTEAVLVWDPP
jgi:3-hydroxyisobutyrate dehydrogenase